MAELYLVRHAQAAFGTDDYDRLTGLGHRQAHWLGAYFAERGLRFDRVVSGTLRRHRETIEGIAAAGVITTAVQAEAGLDEYDPERLVQAHLAATGGQRDRLPQPGPDDAATRKLHFRVLREALTAWTEGSLDAASHRSFAEFQRDAYRAFEAAQRAERAPAGCVLIVSSGGPIASIVARHLGMPAAGFVALNLQVRNSGFCEIGFGTQGARLISFNNVPHLDIAERRRFITFS